MTHFHTNAPHLNINLQLNSLMHKTFS